MRQPGYPQEHTAKQPSRQMALRQEQPVLVPSGKATRRFSLALRIEPAVVFSVRPVSSLTSSGASPAESAAREEFVQIDLAVRMNPNTTATLWLYPTYDSGAAQAKPASPALKTLLTINRNGRYSVTVSISSQDGSVACNPCRLELKSSDNALDRSIVFQLP
jgi:hypothetical protein